MNREKVLEIAGLAEANAAAETAPGGELHVENDHGCTVFTRSTSGADAHRIGATPDSLEPGEVLRLVVADAPGSGPESTQAAHAKVDALWAQGVPRNGHRSLPTPDRNACARASVYVDNGRVIVCVQGQKDVHHHLVTPADMILKYKFTTQTYGMPGNDHFVPAQRYGGSAITTRELSGGLFFLGSDGAENVLIEARMRLIQQYWEEGTDLNTITLNKLEQALIAKMNEVIAEGKHTDDITGILLNPERIRGLHAEGLEQVIAPPPSAQAA